MALNTIMVVISNQSEIHIAVVGQVSAHEADIGHSLAEVTGHRREQNSQSQYSGPHILSQYNEYTTSRVCYRLVDFIAIDHYIIQTFNSLFFLYMYTASPFTVAVV